jgi:hypothetical protein
VRVPNTSSQTGSKALGLWVKKPFGLGRMKMVGTFGRTGLKPDLLPGLFGAYQDMEHTPSETVRSEQVLESLMLGNCKYPNFLSVPWALSPEQK